MRSHQAFHMDVNGWSDYAYNGAACPHGFGFIGRGRGVRSAAQGTTDGNNRSYAIQYMGAGVHEGVEDPLTVEAKRAFYDMAAYLDRPLRRGHRDWKPTACPGEPTYAWRLAGFPRPPGAARPGPTIPEEDELFTYSTPRRAGVPGSGAVFFCHSGKSVGINESTDLPAFRAAGVPHISLDADTFLKFRERFLGA